MISPLGRRAAMSALAGVFDSQKGLTAALSQACEFPLRPGTAFMAFENGWRLAEPLLLWQLMQRLPFPRTPVMIPPAAVGVI